MGKLAVLSVGYSEKLVMSVDDALAAAKLLSGGIASKVNYGTGKEVYIRQVEQPEIKVEIYDDCQVDLTEPVPVEQCPAAEGSAEDITIGDSSEVDQQL